MYTKIVFRTHARTEGREDTRRSALPGPYRRTPGDNNLVSYKCVSLISFFVDFRKLLKKERGESVEITPMRNPLKSDLRVLDCYEPVRLKGS